jgi:hypothetical protein
MVPSPRSDSKSFEDVKLEETTKTSAKRKRDSGRKNVCILFGIYTQFLVSNYITFFFLSF